jgi:hypothetical protein
MARRPSCLSGAIKSRESMLRTIARMVVVWKGWKEELESLCCKSPLTAGEFWFDERASLVNCGMKRVGTWNIRLIWLFCFLEYIPPPRYAQGVSDSICNLTWFAARLKPKPSTELRLLVEESIQKMRVHCNCQLPLSLTLFAQQVETTLSCTHFPSSRLCLDEDGAIGCPNMTSNLPCITSTL